MTKQFDTLYARDSKGKILQWKVSITSAGSTVDISQAYGEYDGAQALRWQRDIQGKNIGKSNETNPYEQAILECESKIKLKKKKGYISIDELRALSNTDLEIVLPVSKFKNLSDDTRDALYIELDTLLPKYRTDADGDIKPMRCQQHYRSKKNWIDPEGNEWSDRKYYYLLNPHVIKEKGAVITKYPCYGQPKINGVRATAKNKDNSPELKSKEGLIYDVAHINDFLNINIDIFGSEGQFVLDGELYIHGELLQDIRSAIVKPNLNTPRVKYILFDIAMADVDTTARWDILKYSIKPKLEIHLNCPIEVIQTVIIKNEAQAQKYTDMCIAKGYEGAIFRQFKGEYSFGGRPATITKNKRCISEEFKIVDVVSQDKDPNKGNYVCVTKEGERFEVNPKGDDAFKEEVLYNRTSYIGKNLTCDFYEYTKSGKPFHVINNLIRDYE